MEKTEEEKDLLLKLKEICNSIEDVSDDDIEFVSEYWTSPFSCEEIRTWISFDDIIKMADLIKEYREHNIENIK